MPRGSGCRALVFVAAMSFPLSEGGLPETFLVLRQAIPASRSGPGNGGAVSSDGRFIAFVSIARLLPADSNKGADVYVFDRARSTLTLESSGAKGLAANGDSHHPRISGDGRYIAFESIATNLIAAPDTGPKPDIFVTRSAHRRDATPHPRRPGARK